MVEIETGVLRSQYFDDRIGSAWREALGPPLLQPWASTFGFLGAIEPPLIPLEASVDVGPVEPEDENAKTHNDL